MSEFIKDIGNLHLKMLNNIASDIAREEREKKKIFNNMLMEYMEVVEDIKDDKNWYIRLDDKEYEDMMWEFKKYADDNTEKVKYHLETSANKTTFCDDVLSIINQYL